MTIPRVLGWQSTSQTPVTPEHRQSSSLHGSSAIELLQSRLSDETMLTSKSPRTRAKVVTIAGTSRVRTIGTPRGCLDQYVAIHVSFPAPPPPRAPLGAQTLDLGLP